MSFSYAAYPNFEFIPQNFPAGQVDIAGKASSGTQVELFVNELTLGTIDVIGNETLVILDGSSIENQVLPFGSMIIFRNEGPRDYYLNISGVYKELSFGEELTYVGTNIGDFSYSDNVEGVNAIISVVDTLVEFKYEFVNDYLENGENDLKFVQKFPYLTYSNESVFEYPINFEKYINDITITNYTNVTNQHSGEIKGYVESVSYPLYYLVNINPNELGNVGALNSLELVGDRFNLSVDNLQEGDNNIYLVSTDPNNQNIFTGVQRVQIFVDTLPPYLNINKVTYEKSGNTYSLDFGSNIYLNGNRLTLEIETDAVFLNYTFNNESFIADEIINNSLNLTLNLDDGLNPLVIEAVDIANNSYKVSHNIYFDDTDPDIIRESLEPEDMFMNNVARFFFKEIEGKTNKPEVTLTIFTLAGDARTMDNQNVDCDDYEDLFIRNLGKMDRERVDGPELNMNETQVSLTNFMFQKTTVTSDSSGEFEAIIGLQENDFSRKEYSDLKKNRSNEIDSVESRNKICFVMSDKYGNFNIHEEDVTLDAGNTMWKPNEITTIPNTIYASEIENAGDQRNDGDNVEFSVIARFQYIGGGKVNSLTSFRIKEDIQTSEHSKHVSIDTGRTKYSLDTDTGEMTAYFVVEVSPLGIKPLEYPDALNLAFEARPVYTVGETNIPIDTQNPIYFQTSVNIESPLDHTKWLTPEMIDQWIGFLNKSIEYTEQAIEWTGLGSVVGVLGCTGMKFYYGVQAATLEKDDPKLDELKHDMFMVCDRVMCSSSPDDCSKTGELSFGKDESGVLTLDQKQIDALNKTQKLSMNSNQLMDEAKVYSTDDNDNRVLAKFNGLNCRGSCDYHGSPGPNDGILCSGEVTSFQDVGGEWLTTEKTSTKFVDNQCIPVNRDKKTGKINALNLQEASNVCYQEGPTHFDETRCPTFGFGEPLKGWNPADNIIESVACGCITDTYSHLKNYLKIQQSIRGCLEQAKIGETQGSYCERLMGTAVCDVATNFLFKTAGQLGDRTNAGGDDPHGNPLFAALDGVQQGDKILNDRYSDSFYSKAGLGTEQIVNKVCLGAVTGDWSVLTDNILSAVDQNEVEPIFGPLLAESRLQGYDPFSGAMSIRYTFTYAAVSGGQRIDSNVEFICDSSQPGGEYCPDGSYTNSQLSSSFTMPRLYVSDGGSTQDTIVITDTQAKYRYNIVKVTHKYQLKGESKEEVIEENIYLKGEAMLANCYFTGGVYGAGTGFSCDTLFDNDAIASAYTIDKTKTKLMPSERKTLYPGDSVYLGLQYGTNGDVANEQTGFDLAFKAECPSANSGGKALKLDYVTVETQNNDVGFVVKDLFSIPVVGAVIEDDYVIYSGESTELFKERDKRIISFSNLQTEQSLLIDWENTISSNIGYSFINCSNRNLLEPKQKLNCEIKITSIAKDKDGNPKSSEIEINLKGNVKDKLGIEVYNDNKKEFTLSPKNIVGSTLTKFDTIGPGICDLTIKLLPKGMGSDAKGSVAAFDDANTLGDSIIASDNIDTQSDFKLSFKVAKELESKAEKEEHTFIEFYNPMEGGGICIDDDDNQYFTIDYVATTASDDDVYFQADWSLVNYANKNGGGYETSESIEGDSAVSLRIFDPDDYDILKRSGKAEPVNIRYRLTEDYDESKPGKVYVEGTHQIKITVKEGNGCSSGSIYDEKYVSNKEGTSEGNSDDGESSNDIGS